MRRKAASSALPKFVAIGLIGILVLALFSYGIAAYLKRSAGSAENEIGKAESVSPGISEDFGGTVKKNVIVTVGETGYSVYVRAAVTVEWKSQEADSTVLAEMPELDIDYSMQLNPEGWIPGSDGYYYYKDPVESGGQTAVLLRLCEQLRDAPQEGYGLSVTIAAQTIQAAGWTDSGTVPAVTDAWGAAVNEDGTLTAP